MRRNRLLKGPFAENGTAVRHQVWTIKHGNASNEMRCCVKITDTTMASSEAHIFGASA